MSDRVLASVVRLTRERDSDTLARSVLETIVDLTPATHAVLYGVSDVLPHVFDHALAVTAARASGQPVDRVSPVASAAQGADALVVECLESHSPRIDVRDRDVRHLFPVVAGGDRIGVLEVVAEVKLGDAQLALIKGFLAVYANYLALLEEGARDKLTGLLNRRTFDDKLTRLLRAQRERKLAEAERDAAVGDASRRQGPVAEATAWLGILDLDHFKRINDGFGHAYGDEVLLTVARKLRSCFRKTDLLFRFGGEEFVVVLEPTTATDALCAFERFRMELEAHAFDQVGTVTISIGFAQISPSDHPPVVLERADRALYYAKDHGRNRTCRYEDLIACGALTEARRTGSIDLF